MTQNQRKLEQKLEALEPRTENVLEKLYQIQAKLVSIEETAKIPVPKLKWYQKKESLKLLDSKDLDFLILGCNR